MKSLKALIGKNNINKALSNLKRKIVALVFDNRDSYHKVSQLVLRNITSYIDTFLGNGNDVIFLYANDFYSLHITAKGFTLFMTPYTEMTFEQCQKIDNYYTIEDILKDKSFYLL